MFDAPGLVTFLENLTQAYMVLVVLLVVDATINAFHQVYMTTTISKGRNIKGYIQVVKIIFQIPWRQIQNIGNLYKAHGIVQQQID